MRELTPERRKEIERDAEATTRYTLASENSPSGHEQRLAAHVRLLLDTLASAESALAAVTAEHYGDLLDQIEWLEKDARLNAAMLAKQCDLARDAEAQTIHLTAERDNFKQEIDAIRAMLVLWDEECAGRYVEEPAPISRLRAMFGKEKP